MIQKTGLPRFFVLFTKSFRMTEDITKRGKNRILDRASVITSRQNPIVSETVKLGDKKHREAQGLFLLDGVKLTLEALSSDLTLEYVLMTEGAARRFEGALSAIPDDTRVYILSDPAFSRVTDEKSPEGVVAAVRYSDAVRREYESADAGSGECRLLLDAVQNPENFGAVMRSARAFGMKDIITGAGCADVYGRRVMRASMGAALHAGTLRTNDLPLVCRELVSRGHRVFAATPSESARSILDIDLRRGDCIVIGNEGHGVSREVMGSVTGSLYIPMEKGQESLNAASAAAVILWELYRSQKK